MFNFGLRRFAALDNFYSLFVLNWVCCGCLLVFNYSSYYTLMLSISNWNLFNLIFFFS